jgi:hypothetical protein
MRDDSPVEGYFIETRAIVETENWTYERRYAHPGDAQRWMIINFLTMAIYKKLCENLPYIIYLLSMTIYETSK